MKEGVVVVLLAALLAARVDAAAVITQDGNLILSIELGSSLLVQRQANTTGNIVATRDAILGGSEISSMIAGALSPVLAQVSALSAQVATLSTDLSSTTTQLEIESSRAQAAELLLQAGLTSLSAGVLTNITAERVRATSSEVSQATQIAQTDSSLATSLGAASSRALGAEASLAASAQAQGSLLSAAITAVASGAVAETARASGVETSIAMATSTAVAALGSTQLAASSSLAVSVSAAAARVATETSRAVGSEASLYTSALFGTAAESSRATLAEASIAASITTAVSGVAAADASLAASVSRAAAQAAAGLAQEASRATGVEQSLAVGLSQAASVESSLAIALYNSTIGLQYGTQAQPGVDCYDVYRVKPTMADGFYYITAGQSTANAFMVYCKVLAGTAFTMVMNLNTRDGNVFWWGNTQWQDSTTYGTLTSSYSFGTDIKSPAWNYLTGQTRIMLIVHTQGSVVGWKSWRRSSGAALGTMLSYFSLGNCVSSGNAACNQLLGDTVDQSSVGGISPAEALVRVSTSLYANYGQWQAAPDMQRFGSPDAVGDNLGGGVGTWHDAGYCYSVPGPYSAFGFPCNNQAFRTCAEAQGGWCSSYSSAPGGAASGTFGTDTCVAQTCSQTNTGNTANWAGSSGLNYDYMVLLGR
eukprot:m.158534 g.158534  ORF g.158534 m.158534 type:complete len:650 (-) comp9826_c0_seq1:170-2119(-)